MNAPAAANPVPTEFAAADSRAEIASSKSAGDATSAENSPETCSPGAPARQSPINSPAAVDPLLAVPWGLVWAATLIVAFGISLASFKTRQTGLFVPAIAFVVAIIAGVFDAALGRIPNAMTYPAILGGLLLAAGASASGLLGWVGVEKFLASPTPAQAILGFLAFGTIGLLCMGLADMSGGDLKLLAAMGAMLGLRGAGNVLTVALAAAVIYALLNLLLTGRLTGALQAAALAGLTLFFLRQRPMIAAIKPWSSRHIPIAVPIALAMPLMHLIQWDSISRWAGGGS